MQLWQMASRVYAMIKIGGCYGGRRKGVWNLMNDCINRKAVIDLIGAMNMCDELDNESYKKLSIRIDELPSVQQWIPCSERMPENEVDVEITYIKKQSKTGETLYFTARAFYTDGTTTTDDSGYYWDDCDNWDYVEEKEAYLIPEGWWEAVYFGERFNAVDQEVIAWRPLPEPYNLNQD